MQIVENAEIPILFLTRDAQNTANTNVFLKVGKKKPVNYSMFWRVMLVFTHFLQCQENVEGAKHCK